MLNKDVIKSVDLKDESFINKMNAFFNPYVVNIDRNKINYKTIVKNLTRTEAHVNRQINHIK